MKKKDYSILTQDDFNNHSHRELAKLQLDSMDRKINRLKIYFIILNILFIVPFIISVIFHIFLLPFFVLIIIALFCIKLKKRINFLNSIRKVVSNFLKDNNLI